MKILESYLGIAKELFGEGNLGENPYAQGKEPKPGDWWKSSEGHDYAMGKDGERQGPFNDAEEAEEYAKGQVDGDDGEDSAGKLSGAGDFERDGGEPEDKPRKDVKGREFDPKTGKGYKANTMADHLKMKKKGYTHTKPKKKSEKGMRLKKSNSMGVGEAGASGLAKIAKEIAKKK